MQSSPHTSSLSTHSLTRLDLAKMPSQGGGSSLRSISPTTRVHPSNCKWMKPPGCGVAANTAYRDIEKMKTIEDKRIVELEIHFKIALFGYK
jgi:hypothetical protein